MKPTSALSKIGKIDFSYTENVGQENRGWVVDKVTGTLNGQEAGYLNMSYIPKENFAKFYPSIIDYMNQIEGWWLGKKKDGILQYVRRILTHYDMDLLNKIDRDKERYDEKWAEELFPILEKEIDHKYKKKFLVFKEFWVDKPLVDYILVKNKFVGTGIGYGLYMAGAKWMAEKHMVLYASTTQSEKAKIVWDKMEKLGKIPIKREQGPYGERKFLDYR